MEQKFLEFIANIFDMNASEVTMDMKYKEGPWDSLMHLRIVAEIFDEYEVDIPIDEVAEITTLRDFYKYIEG